MFLGRGVPGCSRFINHEQIICLTPHNPLQSDRRAGRRAAAANPTEAATLNPRYRSFLPVEVLAASNSSLTDGGDPVLSRGGVRGGGGGVTARSADSRLDRPVAAGVVLCGDGVLQLLVRASAWLYNKQIKRLTLASTNLDG
jgi:hypothetical protein